ncbi:hypothetical protein ACTJKE_06470 [Ensifer sp. 22521]|uniref:hypothetical protein n=1 Tax=Ensifer sp. 22521 TaxID=3453935 RepID=UPI003F82EC61
MLTNILEASLFHLSADGVSVLHRYDRHRHGLGVTSYGTGFLFQASTARDISSAPRDLLPPEQLKLWTQAVEGGYRHLWFHDKGPVLEAPTCAEAEVVDAFLSPQFCPLIDDSEEAREALEELAEEDATFECTPMYFERTAECKLRELRAATSRFDYRTLKSVEEIRLLACAVEWAKHGSHNHWSRCDKVFAEIRDCLLGMIEFRIAQREPDIMSIEEDLFTTKTRIERSLRMTSQWRHEAA